MEIKVKAIHFNATDKLQDFIEKKVAKLEKLEENITSVEVTLNIVKPEAASNKETAIHLFAPGAELHAEKTCDTFEEGVDLCVDILKRQLEKQKEKKSGK
jgi:ribosomal subunit interface protein